MMSYWRVRRFVKTHERKFVIAAGALAACSLLLREVVREDIRDLRDSLTGAKTIFVINTGLISLHQQIGVSQGQTRGLRVDRDESEADKAEEYRIVSTIEAFEAEIDDMDRLLAVMKPNYANERMMDGAKHIAGSIESDLEKAEKLTDDKKKLIRLVQIEEFAESQEQMIFGWQGKMLSEAEEQERSRDRMYQSVTYITDGILVVAAIMGLLGRILDVKGLSGTD